MATLVGAALKVARNYQESIGLDFLSDLAVSARVKLEEGSLGKRDSCKRMTISTLVYSPLEGLPEAFGNVSVSRQARKAEEEGAEIVSFSILYDNHTGRSRDAAEKELYERVNQVYNDLLH